MNQRPTAIPTEHLGITFRSRTEARWAEFFKLGGVLFEYEPEGFQLGTEWYVPDFFLPFSRIYFEVKPSHPSEREIGVAKALAKASTRVVVIACGNPSTAVDMIAYDNIGRQTKVAFYHDNTVKTPWLSEIDPDFESWRTPMAEEYESQGYSRDPTLDEAGQLQFRKPSLEPEPVRPYELWAARNGRRLW